MKGNIAAITAALQAASRDYLNKAADQIKDIIQEFIQQYYDEYTPKEYERTMQFLNSLVRTKVVTTGNKISCEVYIDTDAMNYGRNSNGFTPDGKQVVDWAADGIHGGSIVGGAPFWDNAMSEIRDSGIMTSQFASFMRSKGFVVVGS